MRIPAAAVRDGSAVRSGRGRMITVTATRRTGQGGGCAQIHVSAGFCTGVLVPLYLRMALPPRRVAQPSDFRVWAAGGGQRVIASTETDVACMGCAAAAARVAMVTTIYQFARKRCQQGVGARR